MTDTQAKLIHAKIWDLLSDYAGIRDELENAFDSIRLLYYRKQCAESVSNNVIRSPLSMVLPHQTI